MEPTSTAATTATAATTLTTATTVPALVCSDQSPLEVVVGVVYGLSVLITSALVLYHGIQAKQT